MQKTSLYQELKSLRIIASGAQTLREAKAAVSNCICSRPSRVLLNQAFCQEPGNTHRM